MTSIRHIASICTVTLASFAASGQVADGGPLPEPTNYKWTDEADLISILSSADNKLLVARRIVIQCDDSSNTLSASQRQDGWNIAGHTIYGLGETAEARGVFHRIARMTAPDVSAYEISDAWRMVGQCSRQLGEFNTAYTAYRSALDVAESMNDQAVSDHLTAYLLPFIVDAAFEAHRWNDVIMHVDDVSSRFTQTEILMLPRLVELAGDAAARKGDSQLALSYYEDFATQFPAFEAADLLKSTPLRIHIKKLRQSGIDVFADCSPEAVQKGLAILNDETFNGMILRYSVGDAVAHCLPEKEEEWLAVGFRRVLVSQVDADLRSAYASDHPDYAAELRRQQVKFLYVTAKVAVDLQRDLDVAQAMIDRIQSEFAGVDPHYEQLATQIEQGLQPVP